MKDHKMKFETKEYTLKCPVEFQPEGEKTAPIVIEKAVVQTPKGKQMRQIARLVDRVRSPSDAYSEGEMTLDAIEIITDLPKGALDEMHVGDINNIVEMIAPFLEQALGVKPKSQTSPDGTATTNSK
jgi:hypothetical protein